MIKKTFIVKDEAGLHARPASLLTKVATQYSGDISIEYNTSKGTLKSIMFVMSLGIPHKAEFTIIIENEEDHSALKKLEEVLVENEVI